MVWEGPWTKEEESDMGRGLGLKRDELFKNIWIRKFGLKRNEGIWEGP